jgi:hypothetical protein
MERGSSELFLATCSRNRRQAPGLANAEVPWACRDLISPFLLASTPPEATLA